MSSQETWYDIGVRRRAARDQKIPAAWRINTEEYSSRSNVLDVPSTCGVLNSRELHITSDHDAVDLVAKLRSGEFSAEEVTIAFCKRAAVAQQLTNCLTEIFFDDAISRARSLDQQRLAADPAKPLGPLHGLPISLKDTYQIAGIAATIGLTCYADENYPPSSSTSALPALLLSLGAVLYCKTNVPQTMMTADSENHVFGRTTNPANRALTAGGSTGGEGALISLGGSPLGFGTDLAGSVRIPALCNPGVYGLKPSAGVVPFSGQRMPMQPGWESVGILASAGVMATSARACAFALETVVRARPAEFDSACVRIPWVPSSLSAVDAGNGKKLRVAVVGDDGLFTPTPPVRRALRESVEKLQRAGMDIVPLKLPHIPEMLDIIGSMFGLDGSQHSISLLKEKGEPAIPSVEKSGFLTFGDWIPMSGYYELNRRRQAVWESYRKLWRSHEGGIDAVIMPPAPHTAVPLDAWSTASYTAIFNLLDYPAMTIPVGTVKAEDLADEASNAVYGEADQSLYKLYTEPNDYAGVPVAIQVVGKRQNDQAFAEACLLIDSIVNN
ncbi:amidase [Xylariales sp. PMI_506]|nr:amidase [Xylariales sp. PMI_506]